MKLNKLMICVCVAGSASMLSLPVAAGDTGAFLGGMVTSRVLHNMSARTQAEQQQAYYAQQQATQQRAAPAPTPAAAPAQDSPQQRLDQLDKMAAGGYITPEEYKQKRQSIIDSM